MKTSIFSLSVSTHTPNSSLLFRTQWLLFPPPRYACNAILFFSRSSAVRVGGSLPRFRPTRYFSPLIIENGCVPKKKEISRAKGSNRNDDRKLRATRQKRANEFSSVSLAREILNATTDLKLSSETLTDYPTHAVLQGCRSVQEQDRRQGVFFFPSGESRYPLSLLLSLFFFVEGGWCRGGERRVESRSTFALRMRKSSSIFSHPPPPPPTVVVESIGSVYYVIILFRCIVEKHAVAHIYFRFFPSHRRLSATLSKPRAKPARLPSMALVVSAVTF